jgi:hypothetical protein
MAWPSPSRPKLEKPAVRFYLILIGLCFLVSGCTHPAWEKAAKDWCHSAPNCDVPESDMKEE